MKIVIGVSQSGEVVLDVICSECGYSHMPDVVLTPHEAVDLIAQLQEIVSIAARVQNLPLPWMHEGGAA
jgi:hypothetical protein